MVCRLGPRADGDKCRYDGNYRTLEYRTPTTWALGVIQPRNFKHRIAISLKSISSVKTVPVLLISVTVT